MVTKALGFVGGLGVYARGLGFGVQAFVPSLQALKALGPSRGLRISAGRGLRLRVERFGFSMV